MSLSAVAQTTYPTKPVKLMVGAGAGGGPQVNAFDYPTLDLLFSFYSGDSTNTKGVVVGSING